MKKTKHIKIFFVILFVVIIVLGFSTELIGNSWDLLTGRGFYIPSESSIFNFKVTKYNDGSGEWWLYGEDNRYYYALNIDDPFIPPYYIIVKNNDIVGFDNLNYKTWNIKK